MLKSKLSHLYNFFCRSQNTRLTDTDDEYAQVMLSIRHYSTLRFAMLTLFSGVVGGLLIGLYGDTSDKVPKQVIPLFGLSLTIIFFWLEITLDGYMEAFSKVATKLKPNGHWSQRPTFLVTLVKIPLWGIYFLTLLFWIVSYINLAMQ